MEHEMDHPPIVGAAELFCGHSQKLNVMGQKLLVHRKKQREAAGEYQAETDKDQQGAVIAHQGREPVFIVVAALA